MLKEFKPTLIFLVKFFAVYGILSLLYGWYIGSYDRADPPVTDPVTQLVTVNCTQTAGIFGYEWKIIENDHLNWERHKEQTFDSVYLNNKYAISVEEGCNGINIMILFLAFVVAFGGKLLNMIIFIPAGILFIHLFNIGRLLLLSLLNVEWDGQAFHFFHKYGFTAVIYVSVLILWYLWVSHFSGRTSKSKKKPEHDN
ncbi:MAG: exosortase family protein XrtF [Owenweeksia sp.]